MSLPLSRWFVRSLTLLSGACLSGAIATLTPPAIAAERVTLTYGFVEISTSVKALEAYAERGEVNSELAPYLRFLNEEQQAQFRAALNARQDVSPVAISQFLYSSIGSNILRYLGDIIQTQGRRDGAKGLRGALVLAAAEPEGLSLLGVLEKFPTGGVRIDSRRAFRAFGSFTQLIQNTQAALTAIENQAAPSPLQGSIDPILANAAQPGPQAVSVQTFTVTDTERDRALPTDLYLPETADAPLIVISHGLAGDRKGFVELARHLASYGYAVAALDHPGSNTDQFIALLNGTAQEIAAPTEFSDRPYDVSFLLDELTRLNQAGNRIGNQAGNGAANQTDIAIAGRLNLDQIGIIGHSFGGYTALALAGAQLNFDTLLANCNSEELIYTAANPSMLLQCTALLAPDQFDSDLEDDRIDAVMALNPVTSSLFGPQGLSQTDIPSLIVSGSSDPIAPALVEQIRPFTWLNTPTADGTPRPNHYLALIQGGSHLYDLPSLEGSSDIALANELVSADISLAYSYLKAMSVGFMEAEVSNNPVYQNALSDDAIVQIGQQPLPLYIVESLTSAMLRPTRAQPPAAEAAPNPANVLPESTQ